MIDPVSLKPRISPGWLRVIVFCVLHLSLILTGVLLMTAVIHHLKGDTADAGALMKGELIWVVIAMSFVGSLTTTYIFRRWIDRKSFISLGLRFQHHGGDRIAGFSLALSIIGLATLILYFSGHVKWVDLIFDGRSLLIALGGLILVAFYEEILFRGYILSNLLESMNKWAALGISAMLFTLFHLGNPGFDFLSVLNLFAIGLLLGMNYLYTRNLWFSISFHFVWNFLEGPLMGYPVSGIHFETLLQPEIKGDDSITGGVFGLEGSAIVTVLCVIALLTLYFRMERKISLQSQPAPGQK